MTTIIEKDSSGPASLIVVFILILVVCGGVGFAYMNGAFGEKTTVIENNKTVENRTVENKTVVAPEPAPAAPATAPEKPATPPVAPTTPTQAPSTTTTTTTTPAN